MIKPPVGGSPPTRVAVQSSQPFQVVDALIRLKPTIAIGQWLPPNHPYRLNAVPKFDAVSKIQPKAFPPYRRLAEYIAVSAILHCFDGWSYLARAVGAHLMVDAPASRHLAYYAELRATMALLACHGLGIFNSVHYSLGAHGAIYEVRGGTHAAAHNCLGEWADTPEAVDLITSAVRPGGHSLAEWLGVGTLPVVFKPLAGRLLRAWGFDLTLDVDRNERNRASYRPTGLVELPVQPPASQEGLEWMQTIWRAVEPSSALFAELDRQLLRMTLHEAFLGQVGRRPSASSAQYRAWLQREVMKNLPFAPPASVDETFLSKASSIAATPVLLEADKMPSSRSLPSEVSMMARALLLLRLASGAVRTLIQAAAVNADDLQFWWLSAGERRGLWSHAVAPTNGADLLNTWADVELAIQDLQSWLQKIGGMAYRDYVRSPKLPFAAHFLTTYEHVALWSVV